MVRHDRRLVAMGGSGTGAVSGLPRVCFPCPPAEPDVRFSTASGSPRVLPVAQPLVAELCGHLSPSRRPRPPTTRGFGSEQAGFQLPAEEPPPAPLLLLLG